MDTLRRDLRFAFALLFKRQRGLTLLAVLCLALGIGATTVVFSLVDGIVLKPLAYREPDRLFMVWGEFRRGGAFEIPLSDPEFHDLRERNQVFESIAGLNPWYFNLTGEGEPERLVGALVSPDLFDTLGVEAAIGRTLTRQDETDRERVAVLSDGLWRRRFGADPEVIGKVLTLNDLQFEVVGVMPRGFSFLIEQVEIWTPWVPGVEDARHLRRTFVVARAVDGASDERVAEDLSTLAAGFADEHPDAYPKDSGWGLSAAPLHEVVVGEVRPQMLTLLGAVFLLLLIACVDVANLLLAQGTARSKELALRSALGAGRGAIVRQLLTESVVLALLGGGLGLLFAFWGTRAVTRLDLGRLPRLAEVAVDTRVMLFALGVSVLTGLLFGLAPALQAGRRRLFGVLREGGKTTASSKGRHPLRGLLVVLQIALALVVLVGAGLVIRTVSHLQKVDPGFETEGVVTVQLYLPWAKYWQPEKQIAFYRELMAGLEDRPEIEVPSLICHLPLGPVDQRAELTLEGQERVKGEAAFQVGWRRISPRYFEALGIPLLRGRLFTERDDGEAEPVALVDAAVAERFWPGEDPLGRRFQIGDDAVRTVVGVVGGVKDRALGDTGNEVVYVPYPQRPWPVVGLALRSSLTPAATGAVVREVLGAVDPDQPISNVRGLAEAVEGSMSRPRFNRLLMGLFAVATLLLAAIGVYGVLAFSVAQRRRELGLRMALGARRSDVLGLVLRGGLTLALAGIALGLGLAFVAGRLLSATVASVVEGVELSDPVTFVTVSLLLAALGAAASLVPALRASRLDASTVLRED